jgi:hypothetical protein
LRKGDGRERRRLNRPRDLDAFAAAWMAELRSGAARREGDFGDKVDEVWAPVQAIQAAAAGAG